MSPLRILLIEDDPDIQRMVQLSLRYQGGHQVSVASGGVQGLATVRSDKFDLILLDVMMPEMDGHETCRRLKADQEAKAIPVIFLSARAQQAEIQAGLDLGAIGYLVKPFDPMTLAGQIEAILASAQP